ncbi:hypothetical protein GOP47_0028619 [Adiantum capillus-veneris]|nr:hypothetical protein GOP47_0028619 [Adiantum capillus-veneris]
MGHVDEADTGPSEEHGGKKEVAPANRSVPFLKLFSFASPLDVVLMLIGSVGGAVNGVSMPLIALLLGQLIDAFGKNNSTGDTLDAVTQVSLRFIYIGIGVLIASFSRHMLDDSW